MSKNTNRNILVITISLSSESFILYNLKKINTRHILSWISSETLKAIEERRKRKEKINTAKSERIKKKLQEDYCLKDKKIKSMARRDKRIFIDEQATEAESAAKIGDLKMLYRITKQL